MRLCRELPALACIAAVLLMVSGCDRPAPSGERLPLAELLSGTPAEGFVRALTPRPFEFPADHGPHPEFRNEWWYFTGNLDAADGRHFGFQLTFFRNALTAEPPAGDSAWRTPEVYMAHFAVTDVVGGRLIAAERFDRAALGLAGAQAEPFRVWLGGWEATGFPLRLRADSDSAAIDLTLDTKKPPVLQGEAGLSRKSAEPGNASYYYSLTRLAAAGVLRIDGTEHAVRGLAWMDREWSTSALAPDQVGWDWFALQLDDGHELMLYRLRLQDGGIDPASAGSLVDPAGAKRPLTASDFRLAVLDHWTAPDGSRYPVAWQVEIPGADLALTVRPYVANQLLDLSVRYWEGAVQVEGHHVGRPVAGSGYVELTGYDGGKR